jgi:HPt (histidine-containing phosphotransfer) domain-containing protein
MSPEACLDEAAIDRLMQIGGREFVKKMLDLFLSYVPQKLAEARAAERIGDLQKVREAVHPIKSSAGNIGAIPMRDLAARLEQCAQENQREPAGRLMSELETACGEVMVRLQERRKQLDH